MVRVRKKVSKHTVNKAKIKTYILIFMVMMMSYTLINHSPKPQMNELTTSYISFNNSNATDMMKIKNLKKMNNKIGKSKWNSSTKGFEITGNKGEPYQITLYHIGNEIAEDKIHYALWMNNKLIADDVLNEKEKLENGGIIIYKGKIKETQNIKLKMWIDQDYQKTPQNISYEIRIN